MNVWLLGLLGDADGHTIDILRHADGFWIYCLVFLLILIQEVGVPLPVLPSEVVLLSAGFLASQGKIALVFMGVFAMSATLIGNSLLYYLSRRYGAWRWIGTGSTLCSGPSESIASRRGSAGVAHPY